jgi:hypothetical protein
MPAGLGAVLDASPLSLAATDPAALLDLLLADADQGAAVLARYRGAVDQLP